MKRLLLFLLLAAGCTAAAQKRPATDGLSALQDSIWQWAADNKAADPVANAIYASAVNEPDGVIDVHMIRVDTDHVYVYDTVRFVDRRCVDGVCDRIGRLVVCRPLPDAVLQSGQSVRCGALLCGGRTAGRKQQEQQKAFHGAVRFMLRSRGCRVPRRGRRWPATPRAALFRASGTGCRGRASRP